MWQLLIGRHGKRRRLFAVHRAKPPEPAPFWFELCVGRDDRDDIALAEQLVHPMIRICHMPSFPKMVKAGCLTLVWLKQPFCAVSSNKYSLNERCY